MTDISLRSFLVSFKLFSQKIFFPKFSKKIDCKQNSMNDQMVDLGKMWLNCKL